MYKLNGFRDLEQIAKFLGSSATNNMVINEVVFDSRQAKKNSLFIPLKGEQFDGEEFVQDCLNRGAACLSMNTYEGAVIQVPNVYTALLKLAQQKLENLSPVTFFITGSYGKTTIKDMLKFFIGADCHATSSNENNEFGIPFTILSMPESAKFLVVECGARKQWDFEEISSILKCDVFILTGIAGNHLETFGSIKEIENTKLQLRHSLRNQDNFIDGRIIQETNYERFNKLLVEQALSLINLEKEIHDDDFVPSSGRGNEIQLYEGKIIDHTYNASPHTMISTASKYDPKETILILGDMAELGDTEDKLHLSTLNELKEYQIFVTGNIFKKVFSKADSKQLTYFQGITDFPKDIFVKLLKEGKNLYFKGSRSSKMENYIEALIND